jgi:phenylalanyl-tRNA synthetase alpha chain
LGKNVNANPIPFSFANACAVCYGNAVYVFIIVQSTNFTVKPKCPSPACPEPVEGSKNACPESYRTDIEGYKRGRLLRKYACMNDMISSIETFNNAYHRALEQASDEHALEQVRVQFLGRKGMLQNLMEELKNLPLDQKRIMGPKLNELKKDAEQRWHEASTNRAQKIAHQKAAHAQQFDVTASLYQPMAGSLHVYTHIIKELKDIFVTMGYELVDGPEVETEDHNFGALNIPADHPARESHDTFWLTIPDLLLRTHTSSMQIRAMRTRKPPFAMFAPGRAYRNEAVDASHDFMFTQGELLVVGDNISLSNLLATAQTFLQHFFNTTNLAIRPRPGFFPFVEPGIEIDGTCPFCTSGCSVCKKTKWIELLGAGLVHPNVLRACGIDPERHSGFALGFGIERLAMLKYGIPDIRLFHSSKLSFLRQF